LIRRPELGVQDRVGEERGHGEARGRERRGGVISREGERERGGGYV